MGADFSPPPTPPPPSPPPPPPAYPPTAPPPPAPRVDPATNKGMPTTASYPPQPTEDAWWQSERYLERQRHPPRHPRSTGIVLVTLGILLLAANAGLFSWIEWRTMWPLIFIGLGVLLLARQSGWGR